MHSLPRPMTIDHSTISDSNTNGAGRDRQLPASAKVGASIAAAPIAYRTSMDRYLISLIYRPCTPSKAGRRLAECEYNACSDRANNFEGVRGNPETFSGNAECVI